MRKVKRPTAEVEAAVARLQADFIPKYQIGSAGSASQWFDDHGEDLLLLWGEIGTAACLARVGFPHSSFYSWAKRRGLTRPKGSQPPQRYALPQLRHRLTELSREEINHFKGLVEAAHKEYGYREKARWDAWMETLADYYDGLGDRLAHWVAELGQVNAAMGLAGFKEVLAEIKKLEPPS